MFGMLAAAPCAVHQRARPPLQAAAIPPLTYLQTSSTKIPNAQSTTKTTITHVGVSSSKSKSGSKFGSALFMARIILPSSFLCQVARGTSRGSFEIPNTGISVRPIFRCLECLECRPQRFTRQIWFRPHRNLRGCCVYVAVLCLTNSRGDIPRRSTR